MRREPKRDIEAARDVDGEVVLADVDVVGPREHREIGSVVDDERHDKGPRHVPSLAQHCEQVAVRECLLPDLDDVDSTLHGRLEERRQVGPGAP